MDFESSFKGNTPCLKLLQRLLEDFPIFILVNLGYFNCLHFVHFVIEVEWEAPLVTYRNNRVEFAQL